MEIPSSLCVSSNSSNSLSLEENQGGQSQSDIDSPVLAEKSMVPMATPNVHSGSMGTPRYPRPSASRASESPTNKKFTYDGLAFERELLTKRGFSSNLISTLLASRKPVTTKAYGKVWKKFLSTSAVTLSDQMPIQEILEFLQKGLEKGLATNTLKVQIAALGALYNQDLAGNHWRCALLSSCSGCERRSAGKQSGDVTALLSGCPALTARPEKQSAEDRQRKKAKMDIYDPQTLGVMVFGGFMVISAIGIVLVSSFSMKETSYEEALAKQRKEYEKGQPKIDKKKKDKLTEKKAKPKKKEDKPNGNLAEYQLTAETNKQKKVEREPQETVSSVTPVVCPALEKVVPSPKDRKKKQEKVQKAEPSQTQVAAVTKTVSKSPVLEAPAKVLPVVAVPPVGAKQSTKLTPLGAKQNNKQAPQAEAKPANKQSPRAEAKPGNKQSSQAEAKPTNKQAAQADAKAGNKQADSKASNKQAAQPDAKAGNKQAAQGDAKAGNKQAAQGDAKAGNKQAAQGDAKAGNKQAAQGDAKAGNKQAAQGDAKAGNKQAAQGDAKAGNKQAAQGDAKAGNKQAAQGDAKAGNKQAAQGDAKAGNKQAAQGDAKASNKQAAQGDAKAGNKQAAQGDAKAGSKQAAQGDAKASNKQAAQGDAKASNKQAAQGDVKAGNKQASQAEAKAGNKSPQAAQAEAKAGNKSPQAAQAEAKAGNKSPQAAQAEAKAGNKSSQAEAKPGNNQAPMVEAKMNKQASTVGAKPSAKQNASVTNTQTQPPKKAESVVSNEDHMQEVAPKKKSVPKKKSEP
ncbi:unnamed protein product, partial [Ranitomeya imitator]